MVQYGTSLTYKGILSGTLLWVLALPPNPDWAEKPSHDYPSKFYAQVHKLSPKVKDLIYPGLDSLPRGTIVLRYMWW